MLWGVRFLRSYRLVFLHSSGSFLQGRAYRKVCGLMRLVVGDGAISAQAGVVYIVGHKAYAPSFF